MTEAFVAPSSLAAAITALDEDGGVAVAGGVALSALANLGLASTGRLVSLARIDELNGVREIGGELVLGAVTAHADLAASPLLRSRIPALADMFGRIGNVRVRAWGTVGGSLALAEPAQDPPVLLSALDAAVFTCGPAGSRRIRVGDLAVGPMTTVLKPAELITGVAVRKPAPGDHCAYLKFQPKTADGPVSAGVWLRVGDDGVIGQARVMCGGAGPVVADCPAAVALLVGRQRDDARLLDGLAAAVGEAVEPVSDYCGSEAYKRRVAGVIAERAVVAALADGDRTGTSQ